MGTPKRCAEPTTTSAPHSPGGASSTSARRSAATATSTPRSCSSSTSAAVVADDTGGARVLQEHAEDAVERHVGVRVAHHDVDADRLGAGAHDLDGLRVALVVDEEHVGLVAVDPVQHGHRLGGGGGLVEERRVRHVHCGEVAHHGLEVEERLEATLGDLGLVRRVGGVPGRVLEHVALDHGRRERVGVPLADEGGEHLIAVGEAPQPGECLGLAQWCGQVEPLVVADGVGHGTVDQFLERCDTERVEHGRDLGRVGADVSRCEAFRHVPVRHRVAEATGGRMEARQRSPRHSGLECRR